MGAGAVGYWHCVIGHPYEDEGGIISGASGGAALGVGGETTLGDGCKIVFGGGMVTVLLWVGEAMGASMGAGSDHWLKSSLRLEMAMSWAFVTSSVASLIEVERKLMACRMRSS